MPLRGVAQEVDAELEVLDVDALVGRVDEQRRDLGVHRPHREEAVRDRAERVAHPVAVREAGGADRDRRRRGLHLAHERRDRVPQRRLRRRARAADRLDPLELVVALAERPRGSAARPPPAPARAAGGSRRSRRTSAGITFRFCDASIIVGASVSESSGSTSAPASGWTSPGAARPPPPPAAPRRAAARAAPRSRASCRARAGTRRAARSARAAFTSALSAIPGIDAWPLRPCTRSLNGALIFSADAQR